MCPSIHPGEVGRVLFVAFPNFRGACFPSMATPGFQNSRLFGNRLLLGDRSQPPAAPPCGLSHGITRRGCSRGRVSVGEHARCRVAGRSFCGPRSLAEFPCLLVARVCARVLFLTDTSVHWNHEPAVCGKRRLLLCGLTSSCPRRFNFYTVIAVSSSFVSSGTWAMPPVPQHY